METKTISVAEVAEKIEAEKSKQRARFAAGIPALERLVKVALSDTGQSQVCGRFLLGLYNGPCYRFDLTDLRRLDTELFDDCMSVLRMDANPVREVHNLIEDGDVVFRRLRMYWATEDEASDWPQDERNEWSQHHVDH
jgi:hypothetical protein